MKIRSQRGAIRVPPLLIAALAIAAIPIVALIITGSQRQKADTQPKTDSTRVTVGPNDFPPEFQGVKRVPTLVENPASLDYETKQAITQKVFRWLTNLKNENPNKIYPGNLHCEAGTCSQGTPNNASVFTSVWSRFQRYKLTKNVEDLAVIKRDLNTFSDIARERPIQNSFWGCRLIYELHQSTLPEINPLKNTLQTLCQNIVNVSDSALDIERILDNNQVIEADLDAMLAGRGIASTQLPAKDYYVAYAGLASEFVSRNLWLGDAKDLTRAKLYFAKAAGGFNLKDKRQKVDNFPALGVAALDLYGVTNNSKYLDFATVLIREKQQNGCESLLDCALTAFFAQEYSQVSQNSDYQSLRDRMLAAAVANGYDDKGYPAVVNSLGAFHLFNTTTVIYPTHENFLLTGLLMKQ